MRTLLLLPVLAATACTTLGPNPITTGVSAVPVSRPGVELQVGVMPAFYLSDAANLGEGEGGATSETHAIIEPDRLFGTKGLILGARTWGESGDSPVEPMIGYRRRVHERLSLMGIAFGGTAEGEDQGARYRSTRAGGELAFDVAFETPGKWFGLHVFGTASATYLDATGTYCVAMTGVATDCNNDGTDRRVDGAVEGIYGAGTLGVALDIARRPHGAIQSIRFQLLWAAGMMPSLHDGVQMPSDNGFTTLGAGLQLGFGAPD